MPEEKNGIFKSVKIKSLEATDDDIKKINKLTLEPIAAENIFVFKLILCDNEIDDRNFEPFNLTALQDMQKLYIGKTVGKDHNHQADSMVARIFDTELEQESKSTKAGELYTKLIAKVYMLKTESNADLIAEIKAGIKKEVSTCCVPKKAVCSICGTDNVKEYCSHWGGREYEKDGKKRICYFTLDGVKEAYEVSFVAIPAQPRAGATKNYGGKLKEIEDPETQKNNEIAETSDIERAKAIKLKLEIASALFN